jgi:hypothetical protein
MKQIGHKTKLKKKKKKKGSKTRTLRGSKEIKSSYEKNKTNTHHTPITYILKKEKERKENVCFGVPLCLTHTHCNLFIFMIISHYI